MISMFERMQMNQVIIANICNDNGIDEGNKVAIAADISVYDKVEDILAYCHRILKG